MMFEEYKPTQDHWELVIKEVNEERGHRFAYPSGTEQIICPNCNSMLSYRSIWNENSGKSEIYFYIGHHLVMANDLSCLELQIKDVVE